MDLDENFARAGRGLRNLAHFNFAITENDNSAWHGGWRERDRRQVLHGSVAVTFIWLPAGRILVR